MKKRILSLLLVLVMLLGLLPTVALAADADDYRLTIELDLEDYPLPVERNNYYLAGMLHISGTPEAGKKSTLLFGRSTIVWEPTVPDNINFNVDNSLGVEYWLIDGKRVECGTTVYSNGTEVSEEDLNDSSKNFMYIETTNRGFTTFYKNHYNYDAVMAYESETLRIKPVLSGSGYTYKATVRTSPAESGIVYAAPNKDVENGYNIVAQETDGWTFNHWENKAGETVATSLRYTTTALDHDETFTAVFDEWKKPTIEVVPASASQVSATRTSGDTWSFSITLSPDYIFDYWAEKNEDGTEAKMEGTSQSFSKKLDKDTTYVLHCKPLQITGITRASVSALSGSSQSTDSPAPLYTGTLVTLNVGIDSNYYGNVSGSNFNHIALYKGDMETVKAALAAGETPELIAGTAFGKDIASYGQVSYGIHSWPKVNGKVTVELYTDGCEKFYTDFDVQTVDAEPGLDLTYLSMPDDVKTEDNSSPAVRNVSVFTDESGQLALYAAGWGGVYEMNYAGTTSMTRMAGQEDLVISSGTSSHTGRVVAAGGKDLDDLTALYYVVGDENANFELRRYDRDEGKWVLVPGSVITDVTLYPDSGQHMANTALFMSGTDIWTTTGHWDGKSWSKIDWTTATVNQFFKVDSETAYATTKNNGGTYRYSATTGEWTQITLQGTKPELINVSSSGKMIVKHTEKRRKYAYAVIDSDGTTVLKTLRKPTGYVLGGSWGSSKANPYVTSEWSAYQIGFGANDEIFAVVTGGSANGTARRYILKATDNDWTLMDTHGPDGYDTDGTSAETARPTYITAISNVAPGLTVFYGESGTLYLQSATHTVTFNAGAGSCEPGSYTGRVSTAVPVPQPTREGYTFAGWFTDEACTKSWTETVVPAKNIIVYAKWTQGAEDKFAADRTRAIEQLDKALKRLNKSDYSDKNWDKIQQEHKNGKYQISVAQPNPKSDAQADINQAVNETIYAALNTAVNRMNDIPMRTIPNVTVAVSLDAQTIGLGYLVKPTLVTIPKKTRASVVITDLIVDQYAGDSNVLPTGMGAKGDNGEKSSSPYYAYYMQGEVNDSFYLAHVYWPNQRTVTIADYITRRVGNINVDRDKNGKYLGEFDYLGTSGWMYSVAQVADEEGTVDVVSAPTFPGVGAASWGMQDGEVMRWQFTVYGYGADLNADNSAWGQASITGNSGDKTQLTYDIAVMREEYKKTNAGTANDPYAGADAKLGTSGVYTSVFENVLCDPLATQAELDQAVADLKLVATELAERETFWNLARAIRSMGASEARIAAAEGTFNGFSDAYKRIFELAYPEEFTLLQGVNETTFRPITAVSAEPDTVYGTVNGTMITLGGYRSANETVSLKDQNGSNLTIADGKITIRNVTYTVVDTAVEILPAEVKLSEGAADVKAPEEAKPEVKNVAEAIGSSVTKGETKSEGLASAAASTVVEEAKKKAEESAPAGKEVEVHAETSLNIEVKDYRQDETTNQHVLTLKIEPQVTYTVKEKGTDTVVVPATEPQTIPNSAIKAPVTISVKLPDGMATENLYIKHYFSDRPGQYEYIKPEITPASPSGYIATWQQSSFSTIELLSDARSATVSFNGKEVTLTPADKDQPLPKASKEDKIFTGWIFMIKGEDGTTAEIPGGPFMTLTEDLLTALSKAEPEDITATPNFKDKPKDPEPVTPVTPVTPSAPAQLPQNPNAGTNGKFTDVSANAWYASAVNYAVTNGLMNGTGTGKFSPNADTTRGMIVTMLARLEGQNTSGTPWYAAGQKWAMDAGISDGTNMTGAITREQLAAILFRYAKQKGYDVSKSVELNGFEDANTVSTYATDAMRWAVASGLIQGSANKLSPKSTASRAQVATILMRFMELYAK